MGLGTHVNFPLEQTNGVCLLFCDVALICAGHEADARILQQQLSGLVTEQQAAQQYITDNPPPEIHHDQQKSTETDHFSSKAVDWKWDILRPVDLPAILG